MDMVTKFKSSSRLKSSSSSVQVVLNQDENLLTLILSRVPWKQLMSLKCVSRQWRSLITNPQFTSLCHNLLPLRASGLFIQHCDKVRFVALDDQDSTRSPFRTLTFAPHDPYPRSVRILRSCNGLLLCSTTHSASLIQHKCYVYNPSNNQLAILPKHRPTTPVDYIGLAFDPSKSLHYKVIAFVKTSQSHNNVGDFHIYSSKTKTWNVSLQSFLRVPGLQFDGGVYWHGCMHWLSTGVSNCLYFNVDKGTLETFPRPPIVGRSTLKGSLYFGESEDHLHVTEVTSYDTSLSVYEMKSDYSEWFVKYRINLAPISKVFPDMMKHEACFEGHRYAVGVLSLIRRENFQEDSFLVLEIPGKAIRYNLVDRSFKVIWVSSVDFSPEEVKIWAFGQLKVWPYIETLSCV
ncbi:F-box domain-containing protein [Heracleum sosnowskyi]|uniref:F-box domain-containing protein n=1 Tax=Heracleum sosnowskyi TaxID=360622 RepID=A0AAD8M830_9APIA|nr:F-box domain-containing protein [Heracleum sosnowskyi]